MASVLLIHSVSDVQQAFKEALQGNSEFSLSGVAVSSAEGLSKIVATHPDLVFVQLNMVDGDGFALISQMAQKGLQCYPVPILKGDEGAETWQRLLKMSLRDVLSPPLSKDAILKACRDGVANAPAYISQFAQQGGSSNYMCCVCSARGGVGKTMFATNLTIALAKMQAGTSLIDYSMCAGDIFTVLDHVPRNTMADIISQGASLDGSLLKNLVTKHPLGFEFVACPNDDFDFYSFDYESARAALRLARELSPYTVVDTGVYDLPPTNAAVDEADLLYVICTRDLARIMATQRLIKGFKSRGIEEEKIKLIVNNAELGMELKEEEIEDVLDHPVTAYLPSVPAEATFSINSGKPLMHTQADHPLCLVISRIAEYTLERWIPG